MRLLIIIFLIFLISSCCTIPDTPRHPKLILESNQLIALPKFNRKLLNCVTMLELCTIIKKREVILLDHIETNNILTDEHNSVLKNK